MLCRTSWNRYASERVGVDVGATTTEAGPRGLDRLRSSSVNIDRDALRRLYLDADLTTQEIAATFGCGATTIGRRLKHFGIRVRPRGPRAGSERRGRLPTPSSSAAWSSELAYAIGLIATDGTLSRDGRHLAITSKDRDLLELIRACLRLTNSIRPSANGRGQIYHRMQWSNRVFYDWLRSIGLTPAKTFTLGPVAIPEEYFPDFFRGCIDGDGSVVVYTDQYHAHKNSRYVYKRLYVRLVSASCPFLDWIRTELRRMVGVHGSVEATFTKGRRPIGVLRYAKRESLRLLPWMYYAPSVPALARKRDKAQLFVMNPDRVCCRSVPAWRSWQTRRPQKPLPARA